MTEITPKVCKLETSAAPEQEAPITDDPMPAGENVQVASTDVSTQPPPSHSPLLVPTVLPVADTKEARCRSQIAKLESQIVDLSCKLETTLAQFSQTLYASDEGDLHGIGASKTECLTEDQKHAVLLKADARVKEHIKLLHEYNEIRDVGMGLCAIIAEGRGVKLQTVLDEFGMSSKD